MVLANIYTRFSERRDPEACQSIETQLELCRRYCSQHEYEIAAEYSDPEASGGDEDRPGLWMAVESLRKGSVLVAWRADRIARSVYLSEYIHREVAKKKARIEVVDGSRNGDTPEDVLMRQIFSAFAEYERKLIAARTKASMLRQQDSGLAVSKHPPYGKQLGAPVMMGDKLRNTLVDNPDELEVIDKIIRLGGMGMGQREIARMLDDDRVPCRNGGNWNPALVGRIIARNGELAGNGAK